MVSLKLLVGTGIALLVLIMGLTQIISPILLLRPWFRFTSLVLRGAQPDFDKTQPGSMMYLLENDVEEFKQRYRNLVLRFRILGCFSFCLALCSLCIVFNSN